MLLKELLKLKEAKIVESMNQKVDFKVESLGDGVYVIPSSAPTIKFDKTESIGGANLSMAIDEFNDAIDSGDEYEIENAWFQYTPKNVLNFLSTHKEVVEITAYDGASGELSETLLVATAPSNIEKIIDFMQDPSRHEEDLEDYAEAIAANTNVDVDKLKQWTKKWKTPNKIYALNIGDKTIVMIAEND